MTVSSPVPTFKPNWLRKDNPARGRRPKMPRNAFERTMADYLYERYGHAALGYRRQPKGRRAKSGQWWRRALPPMTFMELADYSFRQSEKKAARMRPPEPMPDWRERVVIDEIPDDQFHAKWHSIGGVPMRVYRSPNRSNEP